MNRSLRWTLAILLTVFTVVAFRVVTAALGTTAAIWQPLPLTDLRLLPGDLIFRRGRSAISRAVLAADGRSPFSHVGIVVALADGHAVAHAMPADGSTHSGVIIEPLVAFLEPRKASAAGVYRVHPIYAQVAPKAAGIALRLARSGIVFDDKFDLESRDRLYCTELVWASYQEAGLDVLDGAFDQLDMPFFKGSTIFPGRLLESPYFHLINHLNQESHEL